VASRGFSIPKVSVKEILVLNGRFQDAIETSHQRGIFETPESHEGQLRDREYDGAKTSSSLEPTNEIMVVAD